MTQGDVSLLVRCWVGSWAIVGVFVGWCCEKFSPFLAFGFFLFLLRLMRDNIAIRVEGSVFRTLVGCTTGSTEGDVGGTSP